MKDITGFIDRQGRFYECEYFKHDETALRLFGRRLEFLDGFIKVWEGRYWIEDGYACYKMAATDEQIKKLVELGIPLDFDELERWNKGI